MESTGPEEDRSASALPPSADAMEIDTPPLPPPPPAHQQQDGIINNRLYYFNEKKCFCSHFFLLLFIYSVAAVISAGASRFGARLDDRHLRSSEQSDRSGVGDESPIADSSLDSSVLNADVQLSVSTCTSFAASFIQI